MREPELNEDFTGVLEILAANLDEAKARLERVLKDFRAAKGALLECSMDAWGCPVGTRICDDRGREFVVSSGELISRDHLNRPALNGRKIKKGGTPSARETYIGTRWTLSETAND